MVSVLIMILLPCSRYASLYGTDADPSRNWYAWTLCEIHASGRGGLIAAHKAMRLVAQSGKAPSETSRLTKPVEPKDNKTKDAATGVGVSSGRHGGSLVLLAVRRRWVGPSLSRITYGPTNRFFGRRAARPKQCRFTKIAAFAFGTRCCAEDLTGRVYLCAVILGFVGLYSHCERCSRYEK